jgi:hypothetical protein
MHACRRAGKKAWCDTSTFDMIMFMMEQSPDRAATSRADAWASDPARKPRSIKALAIWGCVFCIDTHIRDRSSRSCNRVSCGMEFNAEQSRDPCLHSLNSKSTSRCFNKWYYLMSIGNYTYVCNQYVVVSIEYGLDSPFNFLDKEPNIREFHSISVIIICLIF